jgi:hypothetical protein
MEIYNLNNSIAYCEASGLSKCFESYANEAAGEEILQIGFNPKTGYTYIALENGVTICSMLGRQVEYLRDNPNTGEEHFFDFYHEAEEWNPAD